MPNRGRAIIGSMVLEVALIDVRPGEEDAFTIAYRKARQTLATTPGCQSVRMTQGIESPSRFVLLVEWDSIAAHLDNFRATDRFATWRGLIRYGVATEVGGSAVWPARPIPLHLRPTGPSSRSVPAQGTAARAERSGGSLPA